MRVAILLPQATVGLQARMEEMRVMVVGVKMLVRIQAESSKSSKDIMNTVSTTCPQHLLIATRTTFQGNIQIIRTDNECEMLRTSEHREPFNSSLHAVLRLCCPVMRWCSLLDGYQHFIRTCWLHFVNRRIEPNSPRRAQY
jgi:hypothetical protein